MNLAEYVPLFAEKNILVVGDIILDKYIKGVVTRISPEAPVQIVEVEEEVKVLGGAGNVANNICSLGGTAHIACLIGDDENGTLCKRLLEAAKINGESIVIDKTRATTTKVRVIAERQQVVRFDYEKTHKIDADKEAELIKKILLIIPSIDGVIVSDYAKGVVTGSLMKFLVELSEKYSIPVFVDPRPQHSNYYCFGVTAYTPNQKEAYGLGGYMESDIELKDLANELVKKYDANILVTQGAKGMTLFKKLGSSLHIPTYTKEVYDIVGAGDTVIASLTLASVAGAPLEEAAKIANCAAGVVVTKIGTACVTPNELLENIQYAESHISR